MDNCDFVVVLQYPVAECLEYAAHAPHTEAMQFRRPQSAHAGAAEDCNALRQRPQDLLVPDRRRAAEISVNDADRARPRPGHPVDVTLRDGRKTEGLGLKHGCDIFRA